MESIMERESALENEVLAEIHAFAEKHKCACKEYTDEMSFMYDKDSAFALFIENGFIHGFKLNQSPLTPPESVANLRRLTYVETYKATGDLSWLGNLKYLISLSVTASSPTLPKTWGCCQTLSYLTLDYERTKSGVCRIPPSVRQFKSLRSLNVNMDSRSRSVLELPEWNWSRLFPELKNLTFSGCVLRTIPYGIIKTNLPFIMEHHEESDLDRDGIHILNTTLTDGDLSLFYQSREVIEQFYSGSKDTAKECKVVFLGDGGAGKTSLIDKILYNSFKKDSPSTNGVRILTWNTEVNGENIRLKMLDFGGQEIMHSMHRCFLTSHTLYVVVCESRDDVGIDAIAVRWLETVRSFAPGCPVLLVLSKVDLNNNVSVNERQLKGVNQNLRLPALRVSSAIGKDNKYGVSKLISAIKEEVPDCINNFEANEDMLSVKSELESMKEDYITADEYRDLCVQNNISDPKLQRNMLDWFRDLGVAYFYESVEFSPQLDSIRVLNPTWLTNGIYRLILRTPKSGFLSHSVIKQTLSKQHDGDVMPDKTYSPEETEFILYVMRAFEISHNMGNGREMIPMKMAKTPPRSYDHFSKGDSLHLRWEATYLPNNLVHRLMIRKYPELDPSCIWKTGARFKRFDRSALVEMDDSSVDVYVRAAQDSRQYMEEFRSEILRILDSLNISANEIICYTNAQGREGRVPYRDVMRQYNDGREEIYIPGIEDYVSPTEVLKEVYYHWEEETKKSRNSLRGKSEKETRISSESVNNIAGAAESFVNAITSFGKLVLWILRNLLHLPL